MGSLTSSLWLCIASRCALRETQVQYSSSSGFYKDSGIMHGNRVHIPKGFYFSKATRVVLGIVVLLALPLSLLLVDPRPHTGDGSDVERDPGNLGGAAWPLGTHCQLVHVLHEPAFERWRSTFRYMLRVGNLRKTREDWKY